MDEAIRNWAGNISYGGGRVRRPRSLAEVQEIVRGADRVRAFGSRHSFNAIAATEGDQVSLADLERVIRIDTQARTVEVDGGITYGQLCSSLHDKGFALHNLASLPHITVAGACATATHGSGDANGNLATAIAGVEVVTADGDILSLSRGDPSFDGAVVSLGALGLVTSLTLDVVPTFDVRQDVYTGLPFAALVGNFDAIMSSAYSVSIFTAWRGDQANQVWLKSRADAPLDFGDSFHGARLAKRKWHPIETMDATTSTEQLGASGAWHRRLPHFRIELPPSAAGEELQSEYFVGRADAVAALQALREIQDRFAPLLLVSEIRSIAADRLWMSMCYQRASIGLHFTWKPDWAAVREVLPAVEAALAPFAPRPHWGKLFTMAARDVQASYARLGDFRALLNRHDPGGKFRNAFVDAFIFG